MNTTAIAFTSQTNNEENLNTAVLNAAHILKNMIGATKGCLTPANMKSYFVSFRIGCCRIFKDSDLEMNYAQEHPLLRHLQTAITGWEAAGNGRLDADAAKIATWFRTYRDQAAALLQ